MRSTCDCPTTVAPLAVEPFQDLDMEQATDENVFAMGLSQYLELTRPDDVTVTRRGGHVQLRFVYDRT